MSGTQTEAECVTTLSKEPSVSVQAVEAHAVLSVSREFNYYCSQSTHVLKKKKKQQSVITNTVLNICSGFFPGIYCSFQVSLKIQSVFPLLIFIMPV